MTTTITVDAINESASAAVPGAKLRGRVAFVTGGTRGIGAAISKSLASQGATVAAGAGASEHVMAAHTAVPMQPRCPCR